MEKYRRNITLSLSVRLQESPGRIIVVAGPRQIGKTTAVRQVLQARMDRASWAFHAVDAPTLSSEPSVLSFGDGAMDAIDAIALPGAFVPRDAVWLVQTWREARRAALAWERQCMAQSQVAASLQGTDAAAFPYTLVFDEIQKIPDWSTVVKGLWDQDRAEDCPMHVVVLGSAPLLMQRGLSESLMGRFEVLEMTHWSFQEMHDCFDFTLDQFIYFGGYPGPARWVVRQDEARWRSEVLHTLIEPNLVKDILALARIEKPALLRQLFQLACSYSGQIVAMTKLLTQLNDAGNTTTLTHYLELLRASGLIAGLPKYAAQAIRQRSAAPKLNVLNTAFQSVYCGLSFAQARADSHLWGHLVESCIGAHLLNTARDGLSVCYWRESPMEVDFVLQSGTRLCAIEVKSAGVKPDARKGLKAFSERHPGAVVKTMLIGSDDFSLAQALTQPAAQWMD